jgi:Protein of unknown function (DUF1573)
MKTSILTFALSILLTVAAHAQLKWEETTVALHPAIGDKQAVAHFKYENAGKTPIHFKSVRASCGCTAARTQQNVVNPGEKGAITATFNIGGRVGLQIKTVTVQTDDPNAKRATTILTMKVDVPQLLNILPTLVYWQNGEQPQPKTITVKANNNAPVKKLDVHSSNPIFTAKVEPGAGPGEFKISVQPTSTKQTALAALTIKPDYPPNSPQMFYATARVMPTPVPRSAATASPVARPPAFTTRLTPTPKPAASASR